VKNIYVGNLNSGTTPDAIRSLFEPLGTVRKLKLMTDKDSGLSRGFAFVEMRTAEAGQAIATLHGKTVDGQAIQVREGRPKLHRGVSSQRAAGGKSAHAAAGYDNAV
jgi:RNA recognition motif-containing protein